MATINPLASISPIGSATSQSGNRNSGGDALPAGQLLKATVLEVNEENRFLLDISGRQLMAKSSASLTLGQKLQLQVVQTNPQVELKIISNTSDRFWGRSLTLLGKNIDLSELFQVFNQQTPSPLNSVPSASRNILESFFSLQQSNFSGSDSGAVLKELINRLGLTLENILAQGDKEAATSTVKAALLEIANLFRNAENIADATSKLLTTLEMFQLAQLNNQNDRQFIFPLPLPFVEQGYLLVEHDSGRGSDEEPSLAPGRFSLHLTMAELGHIQVDFLHIQETLYIRFRTDSQEKSDFVAQFGDQLKEAISNIPQIDLSFSADAPDPITDLMRQIVPQGETMLDTRV